VITIHNYDIGIPEIVCTERYLSARRRNYISMNDETVIRVNKDND